MSAAAIHEKQANKNQYHGIITIIVSLVGSPLPSAENWRDRKAVSLRGFQVICKYTLRAAIQKKPRRLSFFHWCRQSQTENVSIR